MNGPQRFGTGSSGGRAETSNPSHRLFSLNEAAEYLGVSYWSVRDWVLAGIIAPVHLPALRPREGDRARTTLRRVVIDREDLDRFINARKAGAGELQSSAPQIRAENTGPKPRVVPTLCPQPDDDGFTG